MRKPVILLIATIYALLMPLSVANAGTPTDTLVIADALDGISTLDPHESSQIVNRQIYQSLVGFDVADPTRLFGVLAESWTIEPDGMTFVFKMRQNVHFASGRTMTAHDAEYSLRRSIKLNTPISFIISQFGIRPDNVDEVVTAVDDNTLRISLSEVFSPSFFLYCLSTSAGAILDAEVVSAHEVSGDFGSSWLKKGQAVGTGPFTLSVWNPNQQIVLARNDNYWADEPTLSSIIFLHAPEGATQRFMLEKGDIDVATKLTPDDYRAMEGSPGSVRVSALSGTIYYMAVNSARKPFDSPDAIKALKYLVDYSGIADTILKGAAKVHQTFLPEGYLGYIESNPYRFDSKVARELLSKAGVKEGLKIDMVVWNVYPYADISQAIQATFASAGIEVNIELVDGGQWIERYLSADLDIWLGLWGPDYPDPHSNAKAFSVNKEFSPDGYVSLADRYGFHSEDFSKRAMDAVRQTDSAARAKIYEDLQVDHQNSAPFIFMFQEMRSVGTRDNISGIVLGSTFADDRYWAAKKQ